MNQQGGLSSVKQMDPREILEVDSQRLNADWKPVYLKLLQEIKEGTTRIMRSGNTLFIYTIPQQGVAEVHMATADNPRGIVNAISEFVQAMKIAGFQKIVTDIDNPQMFRLFDAAGVNYQASEMPSQGDAVKYAVEIDL